MKVQYLSQGGPYPAARLESSRGGSIKIRKSAEKICEDIEKLHNTFLIFAEDIPGYVLTEYLQFYIMELINEITQFRALMSDGSLIHKKDKIP